MIQDLFANDNTCLVKAKNITDLITLANSEISNLQKWYNSNLLLIHPQKTKCLLFHPPRTAPDLSKSEDGNYYIPIFLNLNNLDEHDITKIIPIQLVPSDGSAKSLGLLIDNKLNLKCHFKAMHTKVSRAVFSLNQMKHLLDKRHLLLLYNAYVKSNIEYACGLFGLASESTLNPIFLLQKRAVRIICNAGYLDHTAHLFRRERILPIDKLIKFNSMRLMFDYGHALLPSIFIFPKFTWRKNHQVHNVNLRNAHNYYIEFVLGEP
jgi:hypothetical protein